MRRLVLPLAVVLVGTACGEQPATALSEERAAAIRDSVHDLLSEYSSRVERGDWEGVAALYSDDPAFVWVEDGRVVYASAAEVRESLARMAGVFASARTEFESPRVTPLAPGLATIAGRFQHAFTMVDDGELELQGAMTATVVHEEGGWRFLSGHTSTARSE